MAGGCVAGLINDVRASLQVRGRRLGWSVGPGWTIHLKSNSMPWVESQCKWSVEAANGRIYRRSRSQEALSMDNRVS